MGSVTKEFREQTTGEKRQEPGNKAGSWGSGLGLTGKLGMLGEGEAPTGGHTTLRSGTPDATCVW